jgi:hypothetical protein
MPTVRVERYRVGAFRERSRGEFQLRRVDGYGGTTAHSDALPRRMKGLSAGLCSWLMLERLLRIPTPKHNFVIDLLTEPMIAESGRRVPGLV